jgi:hypothetical protein
VGNNVGPSDGATDGKGVGTNVGSNAGRCVGKNVGGDVGSRDGSAVGTSVGTGVGVRQSVPMRLPELMSAPTMDDLLTKIDTERGNRPHRSLSLINRYAVRPVSWPNSVGIAGNSLPAGSTFFAGLRSLF